MSKHSKWAKIKRKKGVADAKKGAAFTRLLQNITVAVKEGGGGDPAMNFRLRLAIDAARAENVPKETIDRAIDRGAGKDNAAQLESLVYEGYGPNQIAVMVETLTDNRNRTSSELRHLFDEHGGSMGSSGAVAWMFTKKAAVRISSTPYPLSNDAELSLIDAGAQDITLNDHIITILAQPHQLQTIKESAEHLGLAVDEACIEWVPAMTITINDETQQEIVANFLDALEEREDVVNVYTNAA